MKAKCRICSDPVDEGRWALGRNTCLECGEIQARELATKRRMQVAPMYNKGAYQYITENDLLYIGR